MSPCYELPVAPSLDGFRTPPLEPSPIKFGTDGWRGILGVDITVERLLPVAAAAARELERSAPVDLHSREVVIGYDRRFLAPELAEAIASAVRGPAWSPCSPTPPCQHRPAAGQWWSGARWGRW